MTIRATRPHILESGTQTDKWSRPSLEEKTDNFIALGGREQQETNHCIRQNLRKAQEDSQARGIDEAEIVKGGRGRAP